MSFAHEYFMPLIYLYGRWIEGYDMAHRLQFKGGKGYGSDYVHKVHHGQYHLHFYDYTKTVKESQHPTLKEHVIDNLIPLFVLNPLQRLVAMAQSYPVMLTRFSNGGTYGQLLSQFTLREGIFFGSLRGSYLALMQFAAILYPSMMVARTGTTTQSKYRQFLMTYTLLDFLLYPLDTLKTIKYATNPKMVSFMKAFNQGLLSLYAGVQYKLIYNLPVVSGLFFSSQKGTETEAFASWVLAGLLFPLNTIKVRTQLANTEMAGTNILNHSKSSLRQLYRGVVPFLLLNAGVGLTLRGLFNEAKIKHIKEYAEHEWTLKYEPTWF